MTQMDQIKHNFIHVNGLKLHVAEIGTGPKVVLFLHGFPEIWYSWRYQMIAVAKSGFRAIAPDYRGYGLSDQPPESEKACHADIVSDLIGILDHLEIKKVFTVGKDFGARPAYLLPLLHPERISGVITLGVPYVPMGPSNFKQHLPEGFYVSRWEVSRLSFISQKPGRAEADFGRFDIKTVVKNVYILFSKSDVPIAAENQEIMDLVQPSTLLPPWFTEEDLDSYAKLYENSGFQTPLQMPYRVKNEEFGIKDPVVKVPCLFIMGMQDYVLKFPGLEAYIRSGTLNQLVPDLDTIEIPEGGHFVQEQFPDQVNQLLLTFLNKHIQL
ncbi:Alpha/beta hydrolase fold-1 [Dillenia turbinata]|uniref:Alpha/beta hydrolase fold-1 n=1 Tax=Dillenia turbinata TaxID=194707 RepID=A0AAN8VMX1_9MAGN